MVSVCLPTDALLQHLPSYLGFSYLGRGVSLHSYSSKAQPLLLTLDEGYLLTTSLPDLQRGIAPLDPPEPTQPRSLDAGSSSWPLPFRHGVLPASARPQTWGSSSQSCLVCWSSQPLVLTSWQINGKTLETETDFIFLGSKITENVDCSHEIKRYMLSGRKAVTNLDSILKSRDITLPTKAHLVKAMVFPVVIYGCESWTIKKAEQQRIDAFELWCWRRLFRVPWTARRSN